MSVCHFNCADTVGFVFSKLFMTFTFSKLPGLSYLLKDPGDRQALRALLKMWMLAKQRQVLGCVLFYCTTRL